MKKILAVLFAFSMCSTAQSESFVDISYLTWSGLPAGLNVDGYGIEYSSVDDNVLLSAGDVIVDVTDDYGYGIRDDGAAFGGKLGIDSFAAGTFYAGAGLTLVDGESDTSFGFGYSKYKIDEFSYDLSVTHSDGESTFGAQIRLPVDNGGGILVGVSDAEIGNIVTLGYSFGY